MLLCKYNIEHPFLKYKQNSHFLLYYKLRSEYKRKVFTTNTLEYRFMTEVNKEKQIDSDHRFDW